jgi:4,5-dihydroxyphthalate decarboxylase
MHPLRLTYRAPRYLDRTLALETGEVEPAGIALEYTPVTSIGGLIEAVQSGSLDMAEVLLGDYLERVAAGDERLVAIPVFPARRFAHRYLFVPTTSALDSLAALRGARIALPRRAASGAVWVRYLLSRAGIEPEDVTMSYGRIGGTLAKRLDLPAEDSAPSIAEQIAAGEVDCLLSPYRLPAEDGGDTLRPLLSDPATHERREICDGGIFPISNVVVLGRDMYERHPWVPCALVDAFAEAKELGRRRLNYFGALGISLPWLAAYLEEIDDLFGGDAYPYGVPANRPALEIFVAFAVRQGVASRPVAVEELFAREVLDHSGIPDPTHYDVPMRGTR